MSRQAAIARNEGLGDIAAAERHMRTLPLLDELRDRWRRAGAEDTNERALLAMQERAAVDGTRFQTRHQSGDNASVQAPPPPSPHTLAHGQWPWDAPNFDPDAYHFPADGMRPPQLHLPTSARQYASLLEPTPRQYNAQMPATAHAPPPAQPGPHFATSPTRAPFAHGMQPQPLQLQHMASPLATAHAAPPAQPATPALTQYQAMAPPPAPAQPQYQTLSPIPAPRQFLRDLAGNLIPFTQSPSPIAPAVDPVLRERAEYATFVAQWHRFQLMQPQHQEPPPTLAQWRQMTAMQTQSRRRRLATTQRRLSARPARA